MDQDEFEVWLDHVFAVTRTACLEYKCLPTAIWGGKLRATKGAAVRHNVSRARLAIGLELRRTIGSEKQGGLLEVRVEGIPAGWAPISFPKMGEVLGCTHGALVHAFNNRRKIARDATLSQVNS